MRSVAEDVGNSEPLCTAGRNINCCVHYEKQYGGPSKN